MTAYPIPSASEISLHGPPDRRIALMKSTELDTYLYTRVNLFQVDSVKRNEVFSCVVRGIAGSNSKTIRTNVFGKYWKNSLHSTAIFTRHLLIHPFGMQIFWLYCLSINTSSIIKDSVSEEYTLTCFVWFVCQLELCLCLTTPVWLLLLL